MATPPSYISSAKNYTTPIQQAIARDFAHANVLDWQLTNNEIAKQKRELEEEQRKQGDFWHRLGRGAKGLVMSAPMAAVGFATGNPALGGAALGSGFLGGVLSSSDADNNAAAYSALAAQAMSSYNARRNANQITSFTGANQNRGNELARMTSMAATTPGMPGVNTSQAELPWYMSNATTSLAGNTAPADVPAFDLPYDEQFVNNLSPEQLEAMGYAL